MQRPTLWDNPEDARRLGRELSAAQGQLEEVERAGRRLEDLTVLLALAEEQPGGIDPVELTSEAKAVLEDLARLEVAGLLGEPHDQANAIVSIHAGAGGTEAADWAEEARPPLDWAEAMVLREPGQRRKPHS